MVNFKPHTAKVKIALESSYHQDSGAFAPAGQIELTFSCRVSPSGGANKIANKDGVWVGSRFLVHADIKAPKVPYGALMEVYRAEELIAQGSVLGSFTNQLNTRIWLG